MLDYIVQEIPHADALRVVVESHYLHRECPCSFSFGLFSGGGLVGVIIYGTPASAPLRRGICGDCEKDNVIELTRLWIQDDCVKNSESFLIAKTLHKVNKEIIVSFADASVGHVGYIYQATNWIYTGLSAKRTDWTVEGLQVHGHTLSDKYTAAEIREKYGSLFALKERPRKHRYVFFNADKRRRRELLGELRYPILPYPKKEQGAIEAAVVAKAEPTVIPILPLEVAPPAPCLPVKTRKPYQQIAMFG